MWEMEALHIIVDKGAPNTGHLIVYLSFEHCSTDCHLFYSHSKLRAGKYKHIKGFPLLMDHLYSSLIKKNISGQS